MKLGHKVIKENKAIILVFSVPKSQDSNEEEKNSITAKSYLKKKTFCERKLKRNGRSPERKALL